MTVHSPKPNRRSILGAALGTPVAMAALPDQAAARAVEAARHLTAADFEPLRGQMVELHRASGGVVRAVVTAVDNHPAPGARPAHLRDCAFSVQLDAADCGAVHEEHLVLSHAGMKPVAMLAQARTQDGQTRFTAVFN